MEGFLRLNDRFLVAKILSKIEVFLGRFLEGYLNIDGAATGAARGLRVVYFRRQTPLGSATLSKITVLLKNQTTICTLEILERRK